MNLYSLATGIGIAVLAVVSFVLLAVRTHWGTRLRTGLRRALERTVGRPGLGWLRWWHLTAAVAVGMTVVMGFHLAVGDYGCIGPGQPSDLRGFLAQGRALWSGGNPFRVAACGGTIQEPDGLAAVLLNAVGSLGGTAGVALVWGAVAVALVPLAWRVAGPDRRYLTLTLATSPLYFPLVASQIDGASNALVPVVVLLTLFLATRGELLSTAVAGFLATQRFPALFPVLGMSGSFRRRFASAFVLAAVFAAFTGVSYLLWGSEFLDPVFFSQLARRSFSLNLWGVFLLGPGLPGGIGLTLVQVALTLALVFAVFLTVKSPLRAAAVTLAGVALLTQFLSFNILVWLLPGVLVGARPRWWLWGIAVVGSLNYDYALSVTAWTQGVVWPSQVLDVVLTVLLVGLLVDLWRSAEPARAPSTDGGSPPAASSRPGKDYVAT
ncbi:MAG: glycosyltransferase 87 family protein [Thermoplasmata archaeon]